MASVRSPALGLMPIPSVLYRFITCHVTRKQFAPRDAQRDPVQGELDQSKGPPDRTIEARMDHRPLLYIKNQITIYIVKLTTIIPYKAKERAMKLCRSHEFMSLQLYEEILM